MNNQPPFWQEKAHRIVGKTVLVGKTCLRGDQEVNRVQFHGPIEMVDEQPGIAIRRIDNGEVEWLPADLRAYSPGEKGVYSLKSTGEEVCDPDFLTIPHDMMTDLPIRHSPPYGVVEVGCASPGRTRCGVSGGPRNRTP